MPDLHIIIDSTANATDDFIKQNPHVHVVPLTVQLGETIYPEQEISLSRLFETVKQGNVFPKTSQPSPGDFLAVMNPLLEAGHDVIVITISSALSGTYQGALSAARMASGRNIWVVDSCTTAIGMLRLAEEAFALYSSGLSGAQTAARLTEYAKRTHTMFVPASLEYLYKGGRIGGAAALFGTILQIKPVLYLVDGRVAVLDKVRTRSRAIARMTEEIFRLNPVDLGVVHLEAEAEGKELALQLGEKYGRPVSVTTGGSVLGSHLGPGLVGAIFRIGAEKEGES